MLWDDEALTEALAWAYGFITRRKDISLGVPLPVVLASLLLPGGSLTWKGAQLLDAHRHFRHADRFASGEERERRAEARALRVLEEVGAVRRARSMRWRRSKHAKRSTKVRSR